MRKLLTFVFAIVGFSFLSFGQTTDFEKMMMEREAQLQQELSITPQFLQSPTQETSRSMTCMPEATYTNAPVDYNNASNCNTDAGYRGAQLVTGFGYPIGGIRVFGIQAILSGGWAPAEHVDPATFELKFYNNNAGVPGEEITELAQTIQPIRTTTGEMFAGSFNIFHWDYIPANPITGLPEEFWISLANTESDSWFMWIDAIGGQDKSMQLDIEEGIWSQNDEPFTLCLVPVLAEPGAPGEPADLDAVAGAMGALNAAVSWTNPSLTFDGEALADIDKVTLEVNEVFEQEFTTPAVGGALTYDFTATEAGMHKFSVYATNSVGDGPTVSKTIWIGNDKPAAPQNVVLTATANGGKVTWDAPTEGLNGGYLNPANTTYTVIRLPNTVVEEDITGTEVNDDFNPSIGNYQYKVIASNDIGEGGSAVSNVALLGAEGILFYEPFDGVPVGELPAGWVKEGFATAAWSVQNTASAGGTAPEMRLYWSPRFTEMSRLVTNSFSPADHENLRFKFKHYLSNYLASGNTLAVQVSFDNGEWVNLWSQELTGSFGPVQQELYITVPAGTTEMRLGWEFNGDVYNINNYNFDNVIVEPVVENDLAAITITGNVTPTVGEATTYTVSVQNSGTATQTAYSVKLMKAGGVELASVDGVAIDFAETKTFDLVWTPEAADEGAVTVYGEVVLASDEIAGNNKTANYVVNVQPAGINAITIGSGTNYPPSRMPFDFYWKNSFTQTIYYADEIGIGGGAITALAYYNNFTSNLTDKAVKVWIAETELENLSGGWIPFDELTLVYDGTMNFPSGENTILIPFDDPYIYGGGNLVVYTNRVWEDGYASSLDRFYGTEDPGSSRSRHLYADGTAPLDPANPGAGSVNNWHPNTTIFLSTAGLAEITGNVVDADTGEPIEGVMVQTFGAKARTFTDEDGMFHFMLMPGTYNLTFDMFGYESRTYSDLVLAEDEHNITTFEDFELTAIPTYTVTGTVKGNDNSTLANASILLSGYDNYEATSGSDGTFTITGVFGGTYNLNITRAGYEVYNQTGVVINEDKDLGTLTLTEIIVAPYALMVEQLNDNADVKFSWNNFVGFSDDFESYDDFIIANIGEYTLYDGDGSSTYGFTGIQFPNTGYVGSYIIFNPFETTPTLAETPAILPHSGNKFIACFAAENGPNNDWLITPKFNALSGMKLSFWAKTYMDYGLEEFRIAVSTTDTNTSSFEFITGKIQAPLAAWAQFEYDLSEFAGQEIHVAIVCVSNDVFVFMVDDLDVSLDTKVAGNILNYTKPSFAYSSVKKTSKDFLGYKVYLDGQLVSGATPITAEEFTFQGLAVNETYTAGVRSVYTSGESDIETIIFTPKAYYTVKGVVKGTEGPLSGVEVKLDARTTTTGATGAFEYADVAEGIYTLSITHTGYEAYTKEVNTANAVGKILDLGDIVLTPIVGILDNTFASIIGYPNPFDSHITLSNAELVKRVVITNSVGQQVMDITLNGKNTINTESLVQGIYLITLQGENGETIVRRMVKR